MSGLHKGWTRTDAGESFTFVRGVTYDKREASGQSGKGLIPILRASNIQSGLITAADDLVFVPAKYVRPEQLLRAGDILIATSSGSRDIVGKTAIAGEKHKRYAFGAFCSVARPKVVDHAKWLAYYTRSRAYRDYVEEVALGLNINNFRTRDLINLPLPLAPLEELRRIVAKLDSLFVRSMSAREELIRIPRLVERYKLAILGAAFRGELTEEWRKAHPHLNLQAASVEQKVQIQHRREGGSNTAESSKAIQFPLTWKAIAVESIGEVILGRQRSPDNHNGPNMRPYVRAANITWDGWDLSDIKEMNFDEGDFKKFKLQPGDVLINEGSGSADEVGKPAIWNGEVENCCFQNTLIAVRPRDATSEYLYFVFLNAALSRAFVDETRGVNIHHIGRAGLAQFVIPLPSSKEQQEIVRRLKTAFSRIDQLFKEATRATDLLDRLDESTLAKAFRGELVRQQLFTETKMGRQE